MMTDGSTPLFSVVIPVYNREDLIKRTLQTVFEQTYTGFEIIVVDDGSTDNTLEVLQKYGDAIRLIKQKNQGPGSARNEGIEAARGTYIAFLDSDDLWFPSSLQHYADVIAQYKQPSFIAGCPFVFHHEAELKDVEKFTPSATYFSDYLASGDAWRWWGVSSFIVKKSALRNVDGFARDWINAEDADLALRLGTEPGFVDVYGAPTFGYRRHGSTAMDHEERTIKGAFHNILAEKRGRYPGGAERRLERWRIIGRHVRPVALQALKAKKFSEAWQIYKLTFPWNFALCRWKFLFGFPVYALRCKFIS